MEGGKLRGNERQCINLQQAEKGLEMVSLLNNKTALKLYQATVEWLTCLGCVNYVPHHLIEEYAVCKARWLECELQEQRNGLLTEHPTTKQPIKSYYVDIGITYLKQADTAYNSILEIIRMYASSSYNNLDSKNDCMEKLLNMKIKKTQN